MPRKKRAALASAENGKISVEERPKKMARIDTQAASGGSGRTPSTVPTVFARQEKEVS